MSSFKDNLKLEEISLNSACTFFGYFEITSNTLLQPFILLISSIAVNGKENLNSPTHAITFLRLAATSVDAFR